MVVEHDRRSIMRRPLRARTEFVRKNGSSSRSLGRKWEDLRLPGSENPRNCMVPDDYENAMMSIHPGVSRICPPRRSVHLHYPCISVHPPSLINDVLGGRDRVNSEMHLEARTEWTQGYTLRPWSSEFGDAFGHRDQVNSEMHFEAVIERVWRCTGRPWSSKFGDALWGRDRARLEMQLEIEIQWTQRCTGRLWLSECGDALAGYNRAGLEEYLEVVDLEGGATAAETLLLVNL